MKHVILIVIAVVLGVMRLFMSPHPPSFNGSYQAMAHVFIGGVGVLAWQGDRSARWVFSLLCGLEVAAAVISRALNS